MCLHIPPSSWSVLEPGSVPVEAREESVSVCGCMGACVCVRTCVLAHINAVFPELACSHDKRCTPNPSSSCQEGTMGDRGLRRAQGRRATPHTKHRRCKQRCHNRVIILHACLACQERAGLSLPGEPERNALDGWGVHCVQRSEPRSATQWCDPFSACAHGLLGARLVTRCEYCASSSRCSCSSVLLAWARL